MQMVAVVVDMRVFMLQGRVVVRMVVRLRQMQHHAQQHQPAAQGHHRARGALAQRQCAERSDEGCKGKHRPRAAGAEGPLGQQVQPQAQSVAGGADGQERGSRAKGGKRFCRQHGQHEGGTSAQQCLDQHHLPRVAVGDPARQGVVHPPGSRGQQHGQQSQQLALARQALLQHQRHAAGQQKQESRHDTPVHGLAVQAPRQHHREKGLQRQHQGGTGPAGALQAPGQRHRADDGAECGHGQHACEVAALQPGLPLRRLPQGEGDQRRPGVEQGGRGERPQAHAEALYQRCAESEQDGRHQGQQAATQGRGRSVHIHGCHSACRGP